MRRYLIFFAMTVFLFFQGGDVLAASVKKAPAKKTASRPQQVVLTSEGGLEWNSVKKTLTAEDRALVVRGDTALGADKIVAYYRESAAGKDGAECRAAAADIHIAVTDRGADSRPAVENIHTAARDCGADSRPAAVDIHIAGTDCGADSRPAVGNIHTAVRDCGADSRAAVGNIHRSL